MFVGAGPGDPGLITAGGLELVRRCEVLVYDRLVAEALVGEALPADAILVPRDAHEQAEINELLVRLARQGYDVVRLKGGDPFVFGRGGEEALALAEAGLEFEVVPGVSSISAVPASAGIPVTTRGLSSQVTIASGHDPAALDYVALARAPGTLVFFMGFGGLAEIAAGLIDHGCDRRDPRGGGCERYDGRPADCHRDTGRDRGRVRGARAARSGRDRRGRRARAAP